MRVAQFSQNSSNLFKNILIFMVFASLVLILYTEKQRERSIVQIRKEIYQNIVYIPPNEDKIPATESFTEKPTDNITKKGTGDWAPNFLADHINDTGRNYNDTCAHYVNPFNIKFNNVIWQVQKMTNETYHLFNAYFDNRQALKGEGPYVRILAMTDKRDLTEKVYCQLWFKDEATPFITNVSKSDYLWYTDWGNEQSPYQPYLFSCKVPPSEELESVSLVAKPCDNATNNLKAIYNLAPFGQKLNFGICVKALNFKHEPLAAIRLVEWIELHKILGADKIIIYELQVHTNISKVLDYYKTAGIVEVMKLTLPGHNPNIPDLMSLYMKHKLWHIQMLLEIIQYTDCFLKNMYLYDYIVPIDVDEAIIPIKVRTWYELIYRVKIPKVAKREDAVETASFVARNVLFVDDKDEYQDWYPGVPKYMHMLQNTHRNVNHTPSDEFIKSFHNTRLVLAVHNHFARLCIGYPNGWCSTEDLQLEEAQMQHYCVGRSKEDCQVKRGKNLTVDTTIWKYKDELIPATQKALRDIGFL